MNEDNATHTREYTHTSSRVRARGVVLGAALVLGAGALSACGGAQRAQQTEEVQTRVHLDYAGDAREATTARLTDNVVQLEVDGIRVLVKQTPGAELMSATIYMDGGAPYWRTDRAGAEALALSTATGAGPEGMTRAEFRAQLDRVGARISASSGDDYASARLSALRSTLDDVWPLFVDSLRTPAFAHEEIELRRRRQLAGISTRMDSPDNAVVEVAQAAAFGDHPYAIHTDGDAESVAEHTVDDLREAMERLLIRERMLVVLVGDIDSADAEALVQEAFGTLPSQPDWATTLANVDDVAELDLSWEAGHIDLLERPDLPTNYIIGYYDAPEHTDDDYAATMLATRILRERLFEEVRTRRNLTYAVAAGMGVRRNNVGYLYVTAADPTTTLGVMYDTIDAMIEDAPSAQDVQDQALVFLTDYYMGLETSEAQAETLAQWELLGGGWENADVINDALREVTPDDISRVLETYVRNLQFGIVGDPDEIPRELMIAR